MTRVEPVWIFLAPFLALAFCACQGNIRSQAQEPVQPVPVWTQAPLFAHVQRGDLQALKEALEKGADPNAVGPEGYSLVKQAVLSKNKDILKYLLNAGAKVNATGSEGVVAAAAHANDLELVRPLVEAGAPVNREIESRVLESPLVVATKFDNIAIMKFLLDRGANPDDSSWLGTTALHMASAKGNRGMILELIQRGADINRKDNYGRTPLMYACKEGEAETVRFLLEKGADPSLLDAFGRDAARYAIEEAHSPEIAALCSRKK